MTSTPHQDTIQIIGLDLPVRIGVPEVERADWQTLSADLTLWSNSDFDSLGDELASTVDYDAVAKAARKLAAERPRKLLETLASELVAHLLKTFPLAAVEVELRKRILPGVNHVSVRLRRSQS